MPHTPLKPLTSEELQILRELAAGRTRSAIARRVETSVRQLYRKLADIRSKLQAENDFQLGVQVYRFDVLDRANPGVSMRSEQPVLCKECNPRQDAEEALAP